MPLVQDHDGGLVEDGAHEAQKLPLSGGEIAAPLPDLLVQALVQPVDEGIRVDVFAGSPDLLVGEALLPKDVFLFSGTIRSNIVLREEGFTDEEIWAACKYVNADSFIGRLDRGLDEEVRERGGNFSAGQRQLLSFVRTILHKPAVMILDEATANIDTETERLIQDSLEKMKNIGTMLIVAHRLSTIQHADQIIVLSHGEILEQGTHQELLARKGRYYQLYTLQFNKQKLLGA